MRRAELAAQFLRFCMVGGVGFLIDAGMTLWLTSRMGLNAMAARVLAFLVAASATWALNRSFTFASAAGAASLPRYVVLTATGAFINLGVYWTWIAQAGRAPLQLLLGVALGSVVAMGFNFFVSRRFVFTS